MESENLGYAMWAVLFAVLIFGIVKAGSYKPIQVIMKKKNKKVETVNSAKEFKKIVFDQLDAIESSCGVIALKWDRRTIPIRTLKHIIKTAKADTSTENAIVNNHNMKFNKCLDDLVSGCNEIATKNGSSHVPVESVRIGISIIKTAYNGK